MVTEAERGKDPMRRIREKGVIIVMPRKEFIPQSPMGLALKTPVVHSVTRSWNKLICYTPLAILLKSMMSRAWLFIIPGCQRVKSLIVFIVTSSPLVPWSFGLNLGVRTWELLLCFPNCFSRFYRLLCFTSLVSVTGSYPEDEPNFGRRFVRLRNDTEVAGHTTREKP